MTGLAFTSMSRENLDRLRAVPLFAGLDETGLERLAAIANQFDAPSGHVLMERGQPGTGIFVIEEGTVRVDLPGGDQVTLRAGDFVGELSVLADAPRTARVCVTDDLKAVAIRRNDLTELLKSEPSIALAMLRALAHRFVGDHPG